MRKKGIKKSITFLTALLLVVTLLPTPSFAEDDTRTLYYSSADEKLHYGSENGPEYSGNAGNWSGSGSTLTLNGNFNYITTAEHALIMSGTLVVNGEYNYLQASRRNGSSTVAATIQSFNNLEITGNGKLSLNAKGTDATHPERCIYTYNNLTISGSVEVYAYAEGGAGGTRTIESANNIIIRDTAVLRADSKAAHSGWAVFARGLQMSGGRIEASSQSADGGGIRLIENLTMIGGTIYSKCSPDAAAYAVAIYGAAPINEISILGNKIDSTFNENYYIAGGTLTKLYANGLTGAFYRAVEVDGAGDVGIPKLDTPLKNIKISMLPASGDCTLKIVYVDEEGNPAGEQTINNIKSGTFITDADLVIPSGYKLNTPFLVMVTMANAVVNVVLEKLITYRLNISYVDESGRQVGSQVITVPKNTVVRDSDFDIPAGYDTVSGFEQTITADQSITVNLKKIIFTLTIEYRDENNWLVGTESIEAPKDTSVTDAKLTPPESYKLKESFSMLATKDETVIVTVVKSDYILTIEYRDEDNWLIDSEKIPVSTHVVVKVTERNLNIPQGYRLKESGFSKDVTKDETVSVTVVSTDDDFNASPWAQEQLKKAEEYGLIPDSLRLKNLTLPISRAEFAAVSVRVYESLMGVSAMPSAINPFTDTSDPDVLKAYNVGITNGTSATTFTPEFFLNREQAATMLTRVFKRVALPGWTLETDSKFTLNFTMPPPFADDADISSWARDSVYFLAANGVIEGIGGNMYAPRNTTAAEEAIGYATTTREQAVAMALRMIQNLKP